VVCPKYYHYHLVFQLGCQETIPVLSSYAVASLYHDSDCSEIRSLVPVLV